MTKINFKPLNQCDSEKPKLVKPLLYALALIGFLGLCGLMFALYEMLLHYKPLMAW